jgi:hypothetical protein
MRIQIKTRECLINARTECTLNMKFDRSFLGQNTTFSISLLSVALI